MITFYQFRNGAIRYMDTEMLNKITDPTTKILVSAFLIATEMKAEKIYNQLKDNSLVKAYELVNDNGDIDIDMAYECIKRAMNNNNLTMQVPILGKLTFTPQDVEIMKNYMVQAENSPQPPMFY